jgi:O-antigen/teichoic acid export membrane protein
MNSKPNPPAVIPAPREVRFSGSGEAPVQALPPLSQLSNGLTLIGAKTITMGLGFLFWVLAARLFAPYDVGLAAGVVAAMMLCTQLAQLGFGSAFITHFPRLKGHAAALLDTSFMLVTALAAVWGGLFLLFASAAFRQLDVVAARIDFALLFVIASVFGTLGILLDQVATALRRGDQALVRNVTFGVGTVGVLAALPLVAGARSAEAIFLPWAVAGAGAAIIGLLQLRRTLPGYRLRPAVDRALAGELVRAGLPNYVLTLAERTPGLILPVLVAELLSPGANATWYTIWMMAWVVYIVPIQVGMTIFSEVSHDPGSLRRSIRRGVLSSLAIGATGALVLGAGAELLLSILGTHYASGGSAPLRVLLLAFIPLTFVQVYFSSCRARRRLREAIVTGWVSGLASIGAAAAAGTSHGLMGMAIAWVSVQYFTGAWSLWRLRLLTSKAPAGGWPSEPASIAATPRLESAAP